MSAPLPARARAEAQLAKAQLAEARLAEARLAEARLAEARLAEARSAEARSPHRAALARACERFEALSLTELGAATLLERVDTKFLVPVPAVEPLLARLLEGYRMLDVEGVRLARYSTLYFDTPDLKLYRAHHGGRRPRYKVRVRSYLDSNERYLELKLRTNKTRTLKTRVPLEEDADAVLGRLYRDDRFAAALPAPHADLEEALLEEALLTQFTRVTLVRKDASERLTVDLGLTVSRHAAERSFPDVAIVEVKQERRGRSHGLAVMKALHLRRGGLSKYCLGIATLEPRAKKNRFKRVLYRLEKVAGSASSAPGDGA